MEPRLALTAPAVDKACRRVTDLAHTHYEAAERVLRARPKGNLRTPKLMGAVYCEILRLMEAQGWASPRTRVRLPKTKLLLIVLANGFGA